MQNVQPQSIMQKALGDQWSLLDDIVRRHYEMAPGTSCRMTINGVMDEVFHSNIAKLFLLPGRMFGALVPYRGKDIPTEVINWTEESSNKMMFWYRTLMFPGRPKAIFRSHMEHAGGDEIIEYVRFGLGIRMKMSVRDGALVFSSAGYIWKLGKVRLPIPTWIILGDAEIVEKAIDDQEFHIYFNMVHPILGRTFGYSGRFAICHNQNE